MELGNQQERRETDLIWLGGFFDGEGSIGLSATKRPTLWMGPIVRIVNTNFEIIEEIASILKAHHIAHHIASLKPSALGNRPTKHVHICGAKRCKPFLELLEPYLRAKKRESELLREWIAIRLSKGKNAQYGDREIDIYIELRLIHGQKLRESSETLRRGLLEARYSPNSARKAERAAEMTAPTGAIL